MANKTEHLYWIDIISEFLKFVKKFNFKQKILNLEQKLSIEYVILHSESSVHKCSVVKHTKKTI